MSGKPEAYVTGRRTFMSVELLAAPGALVPRPETELLGNTAVRLLREEIERAATGEVRVIDMCCGSGNLACGIAAALPAVRLWASDLTDGCVSLARRNVEHTRLSERVEVVQGDLFAPLTGQGLEGAIEMVVCNPPYISTGKLEKESAALLEHEPREAFDGGAYGIAIHQRVVRDALAFLRPRGWLLFEIGVGQARQVKVLFDRSKAYEGFELINDAAGEPRVAVGRRKSE
jgi:release factor glutamine methyltransferase